MDQWSMIRMAILIMVLAFPTSRTSTYEGLRPAGHRYYDLFIDCGATQESKVSNFLFATWKTDGEFTKNGENKLLVSNQSQTEFNTLRFFPKGKKNCYKLHLYDGFRKYFFRAGFYYGNYDGLSNPPSFLLEIDGHLWANVNTSIDEKPSYYELIYIPRKDELQVCLIRSRSDGIPFISSLEAIQTDDMYRSMNNDTALYLHHRINFGANKTVEESIGAVDEHYRRTWKSEEISDYLNIHSEVIPVGSMPENSPPWKVLAYAIQAKHVKSSITLSIDFSPRSSVQAYFVLYFMDPIFRGVPPNATSKVEVYIDNNEMDAFDIRNYYTFEDPCHVLSLYPVAVNGSLAMVTVAPAEGSTLAPILNAMEVFSAIDVSSWGSNFPSLSISLFFMTIYFCFL